MDVLLQKMGLLTIDNINSLNLILKNTKLDNKPINYLSWEELEDMIKNNKTLYVLPPLAYNEIVPLKRDNELFTKYKIETDLPSYGFFVKNGEYATTGYQYAKWITITPEFIRSLRDISSRERVQTLLELSSGLTVKEMEQELDIKQGSIRTILKNLNGVTKTKIKNKNVYNI